jgi:uncharacterized protein (TIGR00369 family)
MTEQKGLGSVFFDQIDHRRFEVDGEMAIEIEVTDDHRGPAGSVHGGLVAMIIDVAGASALARGSERPVATAATSIQYLSAGRVGPVRAVGTVLRASDTLGFVEVRVYDMGKDERLMAVGNLTLKFLSGEAYVRQTT